MLLTILACVTSGILSLLFASALAFRIREKWLSLMVAFSAGVLLASTFLNLLPEAIELAPDDSQRLFITLLLGVLGFFLLQKFSIWRHSHDQFESLKSFDRSIVLNIIIGDAFHNFVDGVLIAASFLVDPWVGLVTTIAVFTHEIPQELGDFIILLNAGISKSNAYLLNGLSSLASITGGILGYIALEQSQSVIPYVLMLSASSFLYIALTDLFPMMQTRYSGDGFVKQLSFMSIGIGIIFTIGFYLH